MARLGELIPRMLVARGIDTVFGIPGVHTVELYRGLPNSGLRHVTPRHEQGAGFMADGYARATGRPAACFIITGPGMTNIATAMGQARNDCVPMLVISANNPRDRQGMGDLHDLPDQSGFAAHVAVWSRRIDAPEGLAPALDAAMAQFASRRPGPVHIEIPIDVLRREVGAHDTAPASLPPPPSPSPTALAEVVMRLSAASHPVLLLGGGAVGIGAALAGALAERLGAATLLTCNARGLLPPGHGLRVGGNMFAQPVRDLVEKADAMLAIGTEFSQTDWCFTNPTRPRLNADALIRVDIDADRLTRNARPGLGIVSDARLFAEALLHSLPRRVDVLPDFSEVRAAAAALIPERFARHRPLLDAIWEHLPDAIVIGDSTEPAYLGLVDATPPAPRRWWTAATGFGTLGYALPAAIGARIGDPRRPVVAIAGDGGALYTLPELAAAVEANAHVILIVWNNSGYNEIREAMIAANVRPEGVALSPVDFQALARGFGAGYARVFAPTFFGEALKAAVLRRAVTVLELREEFWFAA